MVLGRITVNGWYNSYGNIASISEYLCTSATWCTLEKQEGPPTGVVGPIHFHYENLHLTPGASYKARITVTGTNGTSTTIDSVWFMIPTTITPPPPPSTDVVYFEHEPNDAYFYMFNLIGTPNVPPSNVNIIRGAASSGNSDMFRLTVQVPSNKQFCVAIAADGWAPNIDLDVWYRRQGDGAMVSHPGTYTENTPAEITDDSYYCREPAVDGIYYLWVFGNAASVNYELRIKYLANMYPAAPPSSPN
jgi:hypothetical protein